MVHNVSSAITLFEEDFKKFEAEQLFDSKKNYIKETTSLLDKKISNIFQIISLQHASLLRGEKSGQEAYDCDKTAATLTTFVRATVDRTSAEFERKLSKKRLIHANARKKVWEHRKVALDDLVASLCKNIETLTADTKKATEAELDKSLKERIELIKDTRKRIAASLPHALSLVGDPNKVSAEIVQEKGRWITMIPLAKEVEKLRGELTEVTKVVNLFYKPDPQRPYPLRNDFSTFTDLKASLDWDGSELNGFGNRLISSYRERINELKTMQAKYNPAKLESLRAGRADRSEVKKDFDQLSLLIFYLNQTMEVPWNDHPFENVSQTFENLFTEVTPICDEIKGELVPAMQTALGHRIEPAEQMRNLNLLQNQRPETQLTTLQKIWRFICRICSAIASIFRRNPTIED